MTATEGVAPGYVTVHPCGPRPLASSLNFAAGQAVANLVVAAVDPGGDVCLFTNVPVHLVVDVAGWFTGQDAVVPLVPARLHDSRWPASAPRCDAVLYAEGSTVVVRSVLTGAERVVSKPSLGSTQALTMSPDCNGIVGVETLSYGYWFGIEHRFDGSQRQIGKQWLGGSPRALDVLDNGRIVSSGPVVDLENSTSLFSFSNSYRGVGVDRAGLVFAAVSSNLLSTEITYFRLHDGATLAAFTLPRFGHDPSMSRGGDFLAFGASWDDVGGYRELPVITDLDGTVLDEWPGGPVPGPVRTDWLSDDDVLVCIPGRPALLWTIYHDPVPLPGPPRQGCPRGG